VYVGAAAAADGSAATGRVYAWVLAPDGGTPLSLAPDSVSAAEGSPFGYTVSWRGLDTGRRWLAAIGYDGTSRQTLLEIR
jgi:hypothetical protein